VISDRDIWRTAHAMIEQFCDDASVRAAMRVDALLADCDLDGLRVWKRILGAIQEIRREAPIDGERLN
jgi:hypothetical protein